MESYIDWKHAIKDVAMKSIGEDFIIMDAPVLTDIPLEPFKANVTTIVLCQEGYLDGEIGLERFTAHAPSLVVLLADKVLEMKSISRDFKGQVLIMSKRFTDNLLLEIKDRLPLTMSVENKPCQPLSEEATHSLENYFSMMKKAMQMKENPHRSEVARHLMLAFMYGLRFYFHSEADNPKTHNEQLVESFLALVKQYFYKERMLKFYADKLCLTSKHIAKVIKDTTGKAANEWIDDHVILEAKALLKSTDMTIQQVSDILCFDNPSFFTKYFKRHMGMTPKEYRL